MKVGGTHYRSIWAEADATVLVIDQTVLPHVFRTARLGTAAEAAAAIRTMVVRGAPLIGATAAYGLALALREDPSDTGLDTAYRMPHRERRPRPEPSETILALWGSRSIRQPSP